MIVHEPPLLDVAKLHKPLEAELSDVHAIVAEVSGLLQAGDPEGGARLFVEQVLGTGTWQMLPEEYQANLRRQRRNLPRHGCRPSLG